MLYCPDCHSRVIEGECICDLRSPRPPKVNTVSWAFGDHQVFAPDITLEIVNEGPADHMTFRLALRSAYR